MSDYFDRQAYEHLTIDDLNKQLEEIERDNDTIRRQNKLFQSFIERNKKTQELGQEEQSKQVERKGKRGKRGQQQVQEVKTLSLQQKYDIANNELEELKKNILDGEKKSEQLLEYLKAVLDEIDMKIAQIKREAHQFKRDIVMGSENSRTGKIVAEKLIKYIQQRLRLKDQAIDKFHIQNKQLRKKINKQRIKNNQKAQNSDQLQFIDFYQLQIENKKLVRQIDDRNKQLLSLKVTYGKSTLRLTNIKQTLNREQHKLNQLEQEIKDAQLQIQQNIRNIKKVKINTKSISSKQKKYKLQKYEADSLPSVSDYIDLKEEESRLLQQVKTLQRKIQIAQPNHERALRVLRNYRQLSQQQRLQMQIITGEFVLLCILVFLGVRLKKVLPGPGSLLEGLIVYLPPTKEAIQEMKGNNIQLQIGKIDERFSRASQFFDSCELVLSIGVLTTVLTVISVICGHRFVIGFDQNLSFYMSFMMVGFCVQSAYTQIANQGIKTPDNLLGVFFSLTLFFLGSVLLYMDHQKIFDFNFHLSVNLLSLQITAALQHFWSVTFPIDHLTFCVFLSSLLAAAFFPFFRYVFRFTLNYYSSVIVPFDDKEMEKKTWKYPVILVSPLILLVLWIKPMLKDHIVPDYLSEGTFEYIRLFLVVLAFSLRFSNIRVEVQSFLNQCKHLIYSMIEEPTDENIENSTNQCKALASYAWPLAHQSICNIGVSLFLVLLLVTKVNLDKPYPYGIQQEVIQASVPEYLDTEEFIIRDTPPIVTPSRTVTYYKEIKELQDLIQQAKSVRQEEKNLVEIGISVSKLGLIHEVFYRDLFQFALFWQSMTWLFAQILSLLYSRRYSAKLKTR